MSQVEEPTAEDILQHPLLKSELASHGLDKGMMSVHTIMRTHKWASRARLFVERSHSGKELAVEPATNATPPDARVQRWLGRWKPRARASSSWEGRISACRTRGCSRT